MPNCFQLYAKEGPDVPVAFNTIDEKMCKHFNVPVDDKAYYYGWYGTAGFAIACGKPLQTQIAEVLKATEIGRTAEESRYLEVLQWLDDNYTSEAWVEVGRR